MAEINSLASSSINFKNPHRDSLINWPGEKPQVNASHSRYETTTGNRKTETCSRNPFWMQPSHLFSNLVAFDSIIAIENTCVECQNTQSVEETCFPREKILTNESSRPNSFTASPQLGN